MPKSVDTDVQVLPSGLAVHSRVDLTADNNLVTLGYDHHVNWVRDSDGGLVAWISSGIGNSGPPGNVDTGLLFLRAQAPIADASLQPHATADLYLEAQSDANGTSGDAFLTATATFGGGLGQQRTIIHSQGGSDFVQVAQQGNGSGTSGPIVVKASPGGFYFLIIRALGANISHNLGYFWMVHEPSVQSIVQTAWDTAYVGNRVITATFANIIGAAMNTSQNPGFVAAGDANQVTINCGGGTTSWAYTLARFGNIPGP